MRKISVLALAVALLPHTALAQNYNRVITFGDSLSDNGNLFALTGNPPSPPYNRRFTNGFVFAEYLSGGPNSMFSPYQANLGPGSINLAIGGARNDNAANSNGPIPSTISQIATFGTLPVVAGGGFGPNDVVTYFAGANNIFQANVSIPATAQANVQAAAGGAGINTGTQVAGLAASGAKTILVFSLPNFGSTPSYSALGPQGVALGNFATLTYNAAAAQGVQAAAAANPGINFIQIDTTSLIAGVIANPAAFGFTNVTASCVNTPACVGGTFAQQNQFLFWDSVHPTDAAHRILAAAVNDILYTPTNVANVAMLGEIGLWSRRSSMLEMFDKARMPGTKGDAVNYFVSIAGETRRRNTSLTAQQVVGGALVTSNGRYYDYTMGGLRIGGFKNLGNGWTGGFAVSALTGEANAGKISASPTSIDPRSTSIASRKWAARLSIPMRFSSTACSFRSPTGSARRGRAFPTSCIASIPSAS